MKILFLTLVSLFFIKRSCAQAVVGPAEKRITDTICDCLTKLDLTKITNKQEALAAFTECFGKRMDLLMQVADERKVDITNTAEMKQIGVDIAKNLFNQNCAAFTRISVKMAEDKIEKSDSDEEFSEGILKRIDLKGFNYIVISDQNNSEKSFIWLRQFPGSEKFMNGIIALTGKQVKIKWHEIEVYLPQAKGYYKVKEITGVEFL